MDHLSWFREIWTLDSEFQPHDGALQTVHCICGRELRSGREVRLWCEGTSPPLGPFFTPDSRTLIIAYSAGAEVTSCLSMGWAAPARIVDPMVEVWRLFCGTGKLEGLPKLGHALDLVGLPGLDGMHKELMQRRAAEGPPFTAEERQAMLDYCLEDVRVTERLFLRILPHLDTRHAVHRGSYVVTMAQAEAHGIPVDLPLYNELVEHWEDIKLSLIRETDTHGVFEGEVFKQDRWQQFVNSRGIPWPRTPSGRLSTAEETWEEFARLIPELAGYRMLWKILTKLRRFRLPVGPDGRARTGFRPFRTITSRNAPVDESKEDPIMGRKGGFILAKAKFIRHLVKPPPGHAIATIDYSQQEIMVAARLSGDEGMQRACLAGDVYIELGRLLGIVPEDATKQSHPKERQMLKTLSLGILYGMGATTLAASLKLPVSAGQELLQRHRQAFPGYWRWQEGIIEAARLGGKLTSCFGWQLRPRGAAVKLNSILNWPIQTCAAEMMRLAAVRTGERGIKLIATLHDSLMIEAPVGVIDDHVQTTQEAMAWAAEVVLRGFPVKSEATIAKYPGRYIEPDGAEMWAAAMRVLGRDKDGHRL